MMIAHLLERRGINARSEPAGALSMSRLTSWNSEDVDLVCLYYVQSTSSAQIRYAVRRIRRRRLGELSQNFNGNNRSLFSVFE
jgi:hypothetical protein